MIVNAPGLTVFGMAILLDYVPVLASELPSADLPCAAYRQKMIKSSWRPDPKAPSCGLYVETWMGNDFGTAQWMHSVDGTHAVLTIWPCRHEWCFAARSKLL